MSDQSESREGLDKSLFLSLKSQANSALAQIDDIRRGSNVSRLEIWRACEELDKLIITINKAVKERGLGE